MNNTDFQASILNFSALPGSTPNENFSTFIRHARNIATNTGLRWNIELDAKGVACAGHEWDLRKIADDGRPKTYVLRTFSKCDDALRKMVEKNLIQPEFAIVRSVSEGWQDLIKAHSLDHVLVRQKSLSYIGSSSNAWRFLATVSNKEPWEITSDDVILACEISDECQKTKNGRTVILMGLMRSFADPMHLFDACPIASIVNRRTKGRVARAKFTQIESKLPKTLSDRKSEEKLPERRAFWELIRIVFTEKPLTLNDAIRFSMVKLLLITGLRVGEIHHEAIQSA
jgi:integrase